jgi:hypothetical protein
VQAFVGVAPESRGEVRAGHESFDFLVCTPRWLSEKVKSDGYVFGRHYLIVPHYDYALIHRAVTDLCEQAQGPDWDAVANFLARYGRWEFEDYRPL